MAKQKDILQLLSMLDALQDQFTEAENALDELILFAEELTPDVEEDE